MELKSASLACAAAALASAPSAAAHMAPPITITHQMRGCHLWQIGNSRPKVHLRLTLDPGSMLRIRNDDLMPQTLRQDRGPKLRLVHPLMNLRSPTTAVLFERRGTYEFHTVAGKGYKLLGPRDARHDNVLRLTVLVK